MTEEELVRRIQRGDEDAFEHLHNQFRPQVFAYVYNRVGNVPDSEDLTAEVFIRAWTSFPSYEWNGTPIAAWLFCIGRNLIVDRYRKRRIVQEWLPWNLKYRDPSFAAFDDKDELQRALESLSDEKQLILQLRFAEGYQLTEIASLLRKSPSAVRVAQHRALKHLRALLTRTRARPATTRRPILAAAS